jgi:hypothetical protein
MDQKGPSERVSRSLHRRASTAVLSDKSFKMVGGALTDSLPEIECTCDGPEAPRLVSADRLSEMSFLRWLCGRPLRARRSS